MPREIIEDVNKNNVDNEESTHPKENAETNPTIKDQKSVVSEKDLINKGKKNASVDLTKGKASEKINEKTNLNFTKVNKSTKNNTLKGIIDATTFTKVLATKLKKNTPNDSKSNLSKTNNKVNVSVDSSLNKSSASNNKSNVRPNSLKGKTNEITKSKDKITKTNISSNISSKVSVLNKDKNKPQPKGAIPRDNKLNIESTTKIQSKTEIKSEKIEEKGNEISDKMELNKESSNELNPENNKNIIEKQDEIKQEEKITEDSTNNNNPDTLEIIKNELATELPLGGGINLNKTNKNSFEGLGDLKKNFTERNLSTVENNLTKNFEIQEINSELNKEDLDKIKQLEEKRKKLYSKLGYDVIEPQESMSKSTNSRKRKSDLDVFQNVNIKKLAKILERRFYGLEPEEDIEEKIETKTEENAAVEENSETSDFIKINAKKEKRKPTHKRFSLI